MTARLLCCLLAASSCLLAWSETAAAQDCPGSGLLLFDGAVYAEEPAPPDALPGRAAALGSGRLAFLVDEDGCDPRDVEVTELTGTSQDLAVAVDGRPDSIFVLGGRCAGYEDEERARCILEPLMLDARVYTGARYPDGASPGRLVAGGPVGEAELAGQAVTAVGLEGVDPSLAVGVDGRPDETFVAAGVCPYERFAVEETEDDLVRCLRAPLWLVYELERPPAASSGETITARADRSVSELVDGATLSFVPIEGAADVVPSDLSDAVAVATVRVEPGGEVSLPITVPAVDTGIYEAILTCEVCAAEFGGGTVFPAGSLAIVGEEGSGSPRLVGIVIGVLLLVAIIGSLVAWRRGWWRLRSRRASGRPPE